MPTIPQSPVSVNGIFANDANLSVTDITTNNVTSSAHGFAPKSPGNAAQFLNGAATPAFAAVTDANLSVSDITTNDASTSAHGFAPKSWASAWATWSPSYTNITVNNGTVVAKSMQIGKTVIAKWQLIAGTTTTWTNNAHLTLPVTATSYYSAANSFNPIGSIAFNHVGGSIYWGPVNINASTSDAFIYFFGGTTTLTGTVPLALASTDVVSIEIKYEAA